MKAGEGRLCTDESKLDHIFALRSYSQLRETFDEYARISGHDIETAVQNETSGKFEKALLAISN